MVRRVRELEGLLRRIRWLSFSGAGDGAARFYDFDRPEIAGGDPFKIPRLISGKRRQSKIPWCSFSSYPSIPNRTATGELDQSTGRRIWFWYVDEFDWSTLDEVRSEGYPPPPPKYPGNPLYHSPALLPSWLSLSLSLCSREMAAAAVNSVVACAVVRTAAIYGASSPPVLGKEICAPFAADSAPLCSTQPLLI